LWLGDLDLNQD